MESKAVARPNFLAHKTVVVANSIEDLISFQIENTNGLLLVGRTADTREERRKEKKKKRERYKQ